MKVENLLHQVVTIIDPHSRFYGAAVVVKAIQMNTANQPSTVLVSGMGCGELEVSLADVSTGRRKIQPQTEFFI